MFQRQIYWSTTKAWYIVLFEYLHNTITGMKLLQEIKKKDLVHYLPYLKISGRHYHTKHTNQVYHNFVKFWNGMIQIFINKIDN